MESDPKFTTEEVKRDWTILFQTPSQFKANSYRVPVDDFIL